MIVNNTPENRNLYLTSIDQESIQSVNEAIIAILEEDKHLPADVRKPVRLFIDSYGGEIFPAFGLISLIKASKTPIWTVCLGSAFSAAAVILIAGHERYMMKYSTAMIHQISVDLGESSLEDITIGVQESNKNQKLMDDFIIENTKILKRQINAMRRNKKDWYFTPEEALKAGLIDSIIDDVVPLFG